MPTILYVKSPAGTLTTTFSPSQSVTIVVPTFPQFGQTTPIGCH